MSKLSRHIAVVSLVFMVLIACVFPSSIATITTISGIVYGDQGPLPGALVRVRATSDYTRTDAQGRFKLRVHRPGLELYLTAWSPGYYITGTDDPVSPQADNIELFLRPYPTHDNPDYQFISATRDMDNPSACVHCHSDRSGENPSMPVDEWLQDAHAQSATNPRFLSLYNGTSLTGEEGTLTDYQYDVQLGIDIPLNITSPTGAGFKLDFPEQAGNCATCHVPVAAIKAPYDTDPNELHGVAQEGATCDFCHKIQDVRLQSNGRPYPGRPGVLSLNMLRPEGDEQIFIGPFDDVVGDDIFSALQNRSEFCAACHSASFWGVMIYDSFGEWLESPYSDPEHGMTCQDCHMPHTGTRTFAQLPPDESGYVPPRDPDTIFSHLMPGASDQQLLQNTAELIVDTVPDTDKLSIAIKVTNMGAGHHIPTDNPLRNMILLVTVTDREGQQLRQIAGPVIPEWGGVGDPETGHYAGLPGVLYAKVLADYYTGELPTFAYWRQTILHSDNRIPALATDETDYTFAMPDDGAPVTVEVSLYLRRAFIDLMDARAWDVDDVLMEQVQVTIPDV